jgi:hypothetical protein
MERSEIAEMFCVAMYSCYLRNLGCCGPGSGLPLRWRS